MSRIQDVIRLFEWDSDEVEYDDDSLKDVYDVIDDVNYETLDTLESIFDLFLPLSQEIKKLSNKDKKAPLSSDFVKLYTKTFDAFETKIGSYEKQVNIRTKEYHDSDFKDLVSIESDMMPLLEGSNTIEDIYDIVKGMDYYINLFSKVLKHYTQGGKVYMPQDSGLPFDKTCTRIKKQISELQANYKNFK